MGKLTNKIKARNENDGEMRYIQKNIKMVYVGKR